jgi:hypothetical protein
MWLFSSADDRAGQTFRAPSPEYAHYNEQLARRARRNQFSPVVAESSGQFEFLP